MSVPHRAERIIDARDMEAAAIIYRAFHVPVFIGVKYFFLNQVIEIHRNHTALYARSSAIEIYRRFHFIIQARKNFSTFSF
jgi:hypothetical protein